LKAAEPKKAKEHKPRDVAVSTARVDRKVYDDFKAKATRDGFVHFVDCLQVLLSLFSRGKIAPDSLRDCPAGITPAGPKRNKPYTWTIKVERRIWDAFKTKAERSFGTATDCLRLLVAGYANDEIAISAAFSKGGF